MVMVKKKDKGSNLNGNGLMER